MAQQHPKAVGCTTGCTTNSSDVAGSDRTPACALLLCVEVFISWWVGWWFFFLLKEGISLLFDVLLAVVAKGSSVRLQPQ